MGTEFRCHSHDGDQANSCSGRRGRANRTAGRPARRRYRRWHLRLPGFHRALDHQPYAPPGARALLHTLVIASVGFVLVPCVSSAVLILWVRTGGDSIQATFVSILDQRFAAPRPDGDEVSVGTRQREML